ncbi:serine hydrolase domain-containing protein [Nonomuraea wenchangensis]|uniref:serine hydrolase domain-containing protein n=1 Tax=Nonomuraea wenchangensis TaxID=568860 RepID=UPI00332D839B
MAGLVLGAVMAVVELVWVVIAVPLLVMPPTRPWSFRGARWLAEAGDLRLDDPVVRHLPEFCLADPRAEQITIRHLLDHSSGMSDTTNPRGGAVPAGLLRQAVADLRPAWFAAAPGQRQSYHNPNY